MGQPPRCFEPSLPISSLYSWKSLVLLILERDRPMGAIAKRFVF